MLEWMAKRRGRPKMTWWRKIEEDIDKVSLKLEGALDKAKWRKRVQKTAMRTIRLPLAMGKKPNYT